MPVMDSYEHSLARSLAVWANDFSSSPSCVCPVLVKADLNAGTTFLWDSLCPMYLFSSQSTAIAQAGLKLDLVLGLQA